MTAGRWLIVLGMLLLLVCDGWSENACDGIDLKWIEGHTAMPGDVKIISQEDRGGICEVIMARGGNLIPGYAGKDFMVIGRMFRDRRDITVESLNALAPVIEKVREEAKEAEEKAATQRQAFLKENISTLESLISLSFQPGSEKGHLYLITDPHCSHCQKLLPEMEALAVETGMTLDLILYPMEGSDGEAVSIHALCNNLSYVEYVSLPGDGALSACPEALERIHETRSFFRSGGINFVPLVVAGDGSWVVEGGNHLSTVRAHLGLNP